MVSRRGSGLGLRREPVYVSRVRPGETMMAE